MPVLVGFIARHGLLLLSLAASVVVHWQLATTTAPVRTEVQLADRQRGHTSIALEFVASAQPATADPSLAEALATDVPSATAEGAVKIFQRERLAPTAPPPLLASPHGNLPPQLPGASMLSVPRRQSLIADLRRQPVEPTPRTVVPRDPAPAEVAIESPHRLTAQSRQSTGVDTPPRIVTRIDPIYPRDLHLARIEGEVHLRVMIDVDGRPLHVRVAKSSGHASMDAAAVEAVRQWRFTAGTRDSLPRAEEWTVPIHFRIRGAR